MWNSKILFALFICVVEILGASKYNKDDEDHPYEFGFTIDGEQHRHEKKDANGIIQGEFGFITGDGIYHTTVYATDENGNYKILSMRSVRVSPPLDQLDGKLQSFQQKQQQASQQTTAAPPTGRPVRTTPPPNAIAPIISPVSSTRHPGFTTQPTLPQPACAGCGYITTPKPIPGQTNKLPFQLTFNKPGSQIIGPQRVPISNEQQPGHPIQYPAQLPGQRPVQVQEAGHVFGQQPGSGHPSGPTQEHIGFSPNLPVSIQGPFGQKPEPSHDQQPLQQDVIRPDRPSSLPALPQKGDNQHPINSLPGHIAKPEIPLLNQPIHPAIDLVGPPHSPVPIDDVAAIAPRPNRDQITVTPQQIQVPGNAPIAIQDKYPGMVDGLPPGVSTGDITDLLYRFNYTVGFHGHYEKGYKDGSKVGGYFVNDRDGVSRIVTYVADENGYRPKVKFIRLDLTSDDVPKEGSEKKFGLKSFEFVWYPLK